MAAVGLDIVDPEAAVVVAVVPVAVVLVAVVLVTVGAVIVALAVVGPAAAVLAAVVLVAVLAAAAAACACARFARLLDYFARLVRTVAVEDRKLFAVPFVFVATVAADELVVKPRMRFALGRVAVAAAAAEGFARVRFGNSYKRFAVIRTVVAVVPFQRLVEQ